MNKRRVVVTGLGMITPLGIGVQKSWENLIAGKSGIRRITQFDASAFPTQIAGEVEGFNPEDYIEPKEIKKWTVSSILLLQQLKWLWMIPV